MTTAIPPSPPVFLHTISGQTPSDHRLSNRETSAHRGSAHMRVTPSARPPRSEENLSTARLETTYAYRCGDLVAAEFDARVAIALEDGVLIAGEVELYGFDKDHKGAYALCTDQNICDKVRDFVLSNSTETARAYEAIRLSTPTAPQKRRATPDRSASRFGDFVDDYRKCLSRADHPTSKAPFPSP